MPSPITALELIKSSLRLIGVIAYAETPTAEEANDALLTLNDLLETWSTERLSVYGAANESFVTVAGLATYTIGPGGNWNTTRPVRISGAYCTFGGVDFGIREWGQEQYNGVRLKTQQQDIVERYLFINDLPLGRVTLWPVPSSIMPIVLSTDRVLTAAAALATSLSFPPGYALALKHALAIMLAPEYGATIGAEIAQVAKESKANIKRANREPRRMTFDSMLTTDGPAIWQTGD